MLHVLYAEIGSACALAFTEHVVSLFELVSTVRLVAREHILNQQKTMQTTLGWRSSVLVKRGVWPAFFKTF